MGNTYKSRRLSWENVNLVDLQDPLLIRKCHSIASIALLLLMLLITSPFCLLLLQPHQYHVHSIYFALYQSIPFTNENNWQTKCPAFDHADLVKDQSSRQPKKLESDWDSKPPSSLPLPLPTKDRGSQICIRSERFVSTADYNSSIGALLRTPASKSDGRRSHGSRSPAKRIDARMTSPGSLGTSARRNVRRPPDQSPGSRAPTRVVSGPKADLGERPGKRSRSPTKRVGQTDFGRRTDPSPGPFEEIDP